jgi:hypothetical protein
MDVTKKLPAGAPRTRKLTEKYGPALLCDGVIHLVDSWLGCCRVRAGRQCALTSGWRAGGNPLTSQPLSGLVRSRAVVCRFQARMFVVRVRSGLADVNRL